ncbi:hypothetical protein [Allonocardiopsis opalescens]|uniref:hypothetical protein n=1 Tax=Allonocardiopsis opalescens TaxID=1144618 RepID=UPI0011B2645B|nr:hypothetical protein [Allonocardiopsis opalescens]
MSKVRERGAPLIVVQRIAVWWSAAGRGAAEAARRSALPRVLPLPGAPDPDARTTLHDVVLRDSADYRPHAEFGPAPDRPGRPAAAHWGLRFAERGGVLAVCRTSVADAFPQRRPGELFALERGTLGRYRANFRFVSLSHRSEWWYAQWTLTVGYGVERPGAFADTAPAAEVDALVSLYGNGGGRPARPARR